MVKILNRYADLHVYIMKIAEKSAGDRLKPEDIDMTNADIQKCYRDMRKIGFKGSIVDYLCWISVKTILIWWDAQTESIIKLEITKKEKVQKMLECLFDIIRVHLKEAVSLAMIGHKAFGDILESKSGKFILNSFKDEKAFYSLFGNMLTPIMSLAFQISYDINAQYEYVANAKKFASAILDWPGREIVD